MFPLIYQYHPAAGWPPDGTGVQRCCAGRNSYRAPRAASAFAARTFARQSTPTSHFTTSSPYKPSNRRSHALCSGSVAGTGGIGAGGAGSQATSDLGVNTIGFAG